MKYTYLFCLLCATAMLGFSCHRKTIEGKGENGAFMKAKTDDDTPNISRISDSGELIIATISGPDTYFDYQGHGMGLQYALAEDFANTLGVGVRVELATDSLQLIKKLKEGEVDVIAYQLSDKFLKSNGLKAVGATNKKNSTAWAILPKAKDLAEALNDWYGDGVAIRAQKTENTWMKNRTYVRRSVRAPFISRAKGIISTYDNYFKTAARYTGWDWKLIAAQCYQESGFDPNAVSWAGASGLMQIMPATARQYGLSEERLFAPAENIAAAAQHIRYLQRQFSDIASAEERICFVLAAYNGGLGHIRDAQALARKYGSGSQKWADVSYYVRNLSNAQYYRDPIVRYGYMIGNETCNYVASIMDRWRQYGGNIHQMGISSGKSLPNIAGAVRDDNGSQQIVHKQNRYSKKVKILSPEEMQQEQ